MADNNVPDISSFLETAEPAIPAEIEEPTGAPDISSFLPTNDFTDVPVAQAVPQVSEAPDITGFLQASDQYDAMLVQGDDPKEDVPYDPGFISSLGTGAVGVYDSMVRTPAKLLSDAFVSLANEYAPGSDFEAYMIEERARQAREDTIIDDYNRARPTSATLQQIAADDTTVEGAWDLFTESEEKWTVVKEVAGSSLSGTLLLAGGYAGGGLKAVFKLSTMLSFGDDYQESLRQGKGKDEALVSAFIKAPIQGAFDMASFAFPAKVKFANAYADAVAQTLMQGVLGAGAEVGKHVAVGEEYSGGRAALEFAGEFLGAPIEVITARRGVADPRARGKEEIQKLLKQLEEAKGNAAVENQQEVVQDVIDQLDARMKEVLGEAVEPPDIGAMSALEESAAKKLNAGLDLEEITSMPNIDPSTEVAAAAEVLIIDPVTKETVPLADYNWDNGSVAVTTEHHWEPEIAAAQEAVAVEQEKLDNLLVMKALEPGNVEYDSQIVQAQEKIVDLQADKASFEKQHTQELEFAQTAAEAIQTWITTFAPDMRIVYSGSTYGKALAKANGQAGFNIKGDEAAKTNGHMMKLNGKSSYAIEVDLDNTRDLNQIPSQTQFLEVLTHEFGHALIIETFAKASVQEKAALVTGYRKWLKGMLEAPTVSEFLFRRLGAVGASNSARRFNQKESVTAANAKGMGSDTYANAAKFYTYGLNEYVANQLAKSLGTNELIRGPVKGFFKRVSALLKRFYEKNRAYQPDQTYTDFINLLAAKTTMTELNAIKAETEVDTQEKILAKAAATVSSIMGSSNLIPKGPKATQTKFNYGEEEFKHDLDKYNTVLKWGTTLLQMARLNKHIPGFQKYVGFIEEWWTHKNQRQALAEERLKQWGEFKAKDRKNVGAFMQELTVKSYDDGKKYAADSQVYQKLVKKYNMSDEMLAFTDLVNQDFASVLVDLEQAQVDTAEKTYYDDAVRREAAVAEITKHFNELRNRNFFPLSRFGDQFMRVKAQKDMLYDGVEYKAGETITFETFEKEAQMLTRQKVFKNKDKYIVEGGLMNDTQKQFAGFPPQYLEMLQARLELTDVQQEEFRALINDLAPGKSFTKHMLHRKNTPGFSLDAERGYASYFMHFSNYVARVKYKNALEGAIDEVRKSAATIATLTGNNTKRVKIVQYMENHFDAVMDPGNELANLRALGFLWYLGFVPKSAVVNLTQVPLVTYPHLAARYGDAAALAALTKAGKDAGKYWLNPKAMTKGQMDMIHDLIQNGILDESIATELAANAEGSALQRMLPGTFLRSEQAARNIRRMAGAGAWMFQQAEKMNRRVTALAAYDLAIKNGANYEVALRLAKEAVQQTQYEYARWNRPRFMQGKKSVMFLFWQYMQNSLFFVATDPGKLRYVAMMFLFAGLSGLPFAEDAMDLYNYLAKKLNKQFGEDFTDTNIQLSAREFIDQLGMNPDLIMHGSSRYSFGLAHVGDAVGLPIPNVDMSGSLSMGSLIPFLGPMLSDSKFDAGLGRGAENMGGAVVAMPIQMMRAVADNNPDTLKRFERAMPSFAKHLSKAYRYASRGEETLPDGTPVTQFNIDDTMHRNEIIAQGLGFQNTRVADAKAPHYLTKEILQYYNLRKQGFMEQLDYARRTGDKGMERKVWGEIVKYNKSLKNKDLLSMGLRPSVIRSSMKERNRKRLLQERGIVGGKAGFQISKEVLETYEEEDVP